MSKRKKVCTCVKCKRSKPRTEFNANDRLDDGRLPWCDECMQWLRQDGTEEHRKRYNRDYQNAYQKRYRSTKQVGAKKYRARKFTRSLTERSIADLSLANLRHEETQAELFNLWPDVRRSNVWQEFDDLMMDQANSVGEVVRIFDEFRYPELALSEANCVVVEAGVSLGEVRVELGPVDIDEGLRRLRAAILEVLS